MLHSFEPRANYTLLLMCECVCIVDIYRALITYTFITRKLWYMVNVPVCVCVCIKSRQRMVNKILLLSLMSFSVWSIIRRAHHIPYLLIQTYIFSHIKCRFRLFCIHPKNICYGCINVFISVHTYLFEKRKKKRTNKKKMISTAKKYVRN